MDEAELASGAEAAGAPVEEEPSPVTVDRSGEPAAAEGQGEPWMAALERHLVGDPPKFGDPTPPAPPLSVELPKPTVDIASLWDLEPEGSAAAPVPSEIPEPTPQPIVTPQPQEDPPAAPQPIETPADPWEMPPAPQPAETPQPVEIPASTPPAPPPAAPMRAGQGPFDRDIERMLDEWDRKEPRLD